MDQLPVRQLSRFASELHLSGIDALTRLSPDTNEDGIVVLVVLRVCLPDWVADGQPAAPTAPRCATTLRALSRSLGRPLGSIHGLVARLIDRGLLARGPAGLFVSPAASDRVVAYLEEVHDLVLRFAADVHATGVLASGRRAARPCPIRTILAVGLDMMLIPFETFRDELGDWTAKKLWIALSTLTVRHVTVDPTLSDRYAVASTPDSERHPVPAALLRAVTHLSTPTAWRRLKAMEAAGLAAQRDGGWTIRSSQLLEPAVEAGVRASLDYYLRRLNELVAAGLEAGHPPYRNGRPALVAEGACLGGR